MHLIFFSEITGVSLLILSMWLAQKPVVPTLMGLASTIFILRLRPDNIYILGFMATCITFEVITSVVGYQNILSRSRVNFIIVILISIISTAAAGFIIGNLFMIDLISKMAVNILTFTALHGIGGLIGGVLGITIVRVIEALCVDRKNGLQSESTVS